MHKCQQGDQKMLMTLNKQIQLHIALYVESLTRANVHIYMENSKYKNFSIDHMSIWLFML